MSKKKIVISIISLFVILAIVFCIVHSANQNEDVAIIQKAWNSTRVYYSPRTIKTVWVLHYNDLEKILDKAYSGSGTSLALHYEVDKDLVPWFPEEGYLLYINERYFAIVEENGQVIKVIDNSEYIRKSTDSSLSIDENYSYSTAALDIGLFLKSARFDILWNAPKGMNNWYLVSENVLNKIK